MRNNFTYNGFFSASLLLVGMLGSRGCLDHSIEEWNYNEPGSTDIEEQNSEQEVSTALIDNTSPASTEMDTAFDTFIWEQENATDSHGIYPQDTVFDPESWPDPDFDAYRDTLYPQDTAFDTMFAGFNTTDLDAYKNDIGLPYDLDAGLPPDEPLYPKEPESDFSMDTMFDPTLWELSTDLDAYSNK